TESENQQKSSDDEFKPESEKSKSESEETDHSSEEEIIPKKTRLTRSQRIHMVENYQENSPDLTEFNQEEKISEWEYELDSESQVFKKPKIPNLTDSAIKPFISSKSKPPKIIIYECPFCARAFTYPLVFKTHLYSCDQNKNIPEYILYCIKCDFKSRKKQDMVNHYTDEHLKDENSDQDEDSVSKFELTTCKKNQLKATSYLFIDTLVYKFTKDFCSMLFEMDKNFKKIDQILEHGIERQYLIDLIDLDSKTLEFQCNKLNFGLKSLETYQIKNSKNNFKLINLMDQITSIDWCPVIQLDQYMAVSTMPNSNILSQIVQQPQTKFKSILENFFHPNLIYIFKFSNLNSTNGIKKFALLNKQIGHISQLKWRPDFGKTNSLVPEYIGYLLACGSDGNGYIYRLRDMCDQVDEEKKMFCYEQKNFLILKPNFSFGQCTSGDWSQLNGACQIALGYSNGSVAIYQLNTKSLEKQYLNSEKRPNAIHPNRVIHAHFTFVKTIKWSKLNCGLLCTGSIFSREIKLWNLGQPNRPVFDYETFSTDFEFSLHSNDLLISKEINLKGENHMVALTLEFNLLNNDKDESRAHSSLFFTNSTMNSIHQSDYLNKFLLCDNDGWVVLCRSDNSKYWLQKNKPMCNTFMRIAKFEAKDAEKRKENCYNLSSLTEKNDVKISICLDHTSLKPGNKQTSNQLNSISINVNSLSKIRWNQNLGFLNWYACASLSGFLFIQKIEELNV
ncbi:general transcription factor 3C polypeptide 2, partial [Brachionus plicatilis]